MPKTSKPTRSHISESSIALKLAEQMNNYFTIHSDSLRIVQQDPVKFDQETRNFKSSPNAITSLDPNFFADGKAQIAIYDDILKKEPVSYEDYFYRAQYALSAAFLFNHFVVAEKLEDKTFENQFWGEVDRRQLEYQQEHYPGTIPEDVELPKYNLPHLSQLRPLLPRWRRLSTSRIHISCSKKYSCCRMGLFGKWIKWSWIETGLATGFTLMAWRHVQWRLRIWRCSCVRAVSPGYVHHNVDYYRSPMYFMIGRECV